jgi:hypothetical protein
MNPFYGTINPDDIPPEAAMVAVAVINYDLLGWG